MTTLNFYFAPDPLWPVRLWPDLAAGRRGGVWGSGSPTRLPRLCASAPEGRRRKNTNHFVVEAFAFTMRCVCFPWPIAFQRCSGSSLDLVRGMLRHQGHGSGFGFLDVASKG